MMHHIDLSTVLRETVSCDLYSNLVTRPTGAAVRGEIERLLSATRDRSLTVIDFSHVSMIDFSCADEVIAKLLIEYSRDDSPREAYFVFRGVTEEHWEAIEAVLERRGLALVLDAPDGPAIVGFLPEIERVAWEAIHRLGRADADDLADAIETDRREAQHALDALWRRRLVMKLEQGYATIGVRRGE